MRILVTGSRSWDDAKTIHVALDALGRGLIEGRDPVFVVVHGACPDGADAIADRWVRENASRWVRYSAGPGDDRPMLTAERHPALWQKFGKRAGPVRNEIMVSRGASLCLAFIAPCSNSDCDEPKPHGSHGATHCAELASDAGIPMRVWHLGEPGVTALDSRHLADEDVMP